ncbi:MAG: hypothetical protein HW421_1682 [Ignavibacteria bacterium]|nr:hypothetical protein [Ignavibacteria bacterium]
MKTFLILSVFLLSIVIANGQVKWGIKLSGGITNVTDEKESIGPKFGFQIGGLGIYNINPDWGIQFEGLYSSKGAESSDDPPVKFNFTYLEIPVLIKFKVSEVGEHKGRLNLIGGFYYGAKLSGEVEIQNIKLDADGLESSDFGLIFGIDAFLSRRLSIDGRFSYGLSNLTKSGTSNNLGILAGIAYYFN